MFELILTHSTIRNIRRTVRGLYMLKLGLEGLIFESVFVIFRIIKQEVSVASQGLHKTQLIIV